MREKITVQTVIGAPIQKVWEYFTDPKHVVAWNNASDDWTTPHAENNLVPGGTFSYRMEAKDGSRGFDFGGVYDEVVELQRLTYMMGDGRKVIVVFAPIGDQTELTETFEAESQNSVEVQRHGWQAILNNFKRYVESIPL